MSAARCPGKQPFFHGSSAGSTGLSGMAGFMISMVSAQPHGQLPALVLWVADQPIAALVSCRFWLFLLRRHLGFGAFSLPQGRLLRVPVRILWPLSTDPKPAAGGRNGSRRFFPRLFDPSARPLRSQKSGVLAVLRCATTRGVRPPAEWRVLVVLFERLR
jgi:hypothetical protein